MATGQISGPLLQANLERNGINLSVETDLLYIDVNNGRIGVNTNSPSTALDVTGDIHASGEVSATTMSTDLIDISDIVINGNTISATNVSDLTLASSSGAIAFSSHAEFAGQVRGPAEFIINPVPWASNTGTVNVQGSLVVSGTNADFSPSVLVVANNSVDKSEANAAGLTVNLGTDGLATLSYVSILDSFQFNKPLILDAGISTGDSLSTTDITLTGQIKGPSNFILDPAVHGNNTGTVTIAGDLSVLGTLSGGNLLTTNVTEGANLYYTDARTRSALSAAGDLNYNSSTGEFGVTTYKTTDFATDLAASDTDDVSEGTTNLYYTNARSRQAISATGDLSYDSNTGVISFSAAAAQSLDSVTGVGNTTTNSITVGSITTTGALNGPATFTIDPAAHGDNTGTVVIAGNLQVDGTSTTVNSATLDVADLNITVAKGAVSAAAANGAGLTVDGAAATLTYASADNSWNFNKIVKISGNRVLTVADEGTGNGLDADTLDSQHGSFYRNASNINAGTINDARLPTSISSDTTGNAATATTASTAAAVTNGVYTVGTQTIGGAKTFTSPIKITSGGATLDFGPLNTSYCHFNTTATSGFYFYDNIVTAGNILPSANNIKNIGSASLKYANVYATTFQGKATTAQYADLAENYIADNNYAPGTVLEFGGKHDVTKSSIANTHRIAGVVTTNPAHLMDSELEGEFIAAIALQGKVPCKVMGYAQKGDMLVASEFPGVAIVNNEPKVGTVIGKALENKDTIEAKLMMVVVGRD